MTDETVVEADGVRVTKSFDADGFPVPAVRFDVTSTRDDETTLTITDEIPDEFDIDQIGFHPEYGSEYWTATGDGVVRFERSIDADTDFTTVYGVRMGEDEEPSAFLDAPTIAVGEPAAPATGIEDVVPPESSDIVRELAGGKRDTIPGLEDDADDGESDVSEANEPLLDALHEDGEDVAQAESSDADDDAPGDDAIDETPGDESDDADVAAPEPAADGPSVADVAAGEGSAGPADPASEDAVDADLDAGVSTASATGGEIPAEDVAAALADELRNDRIADDDLRVLREELAPKRSSVQIEHLQSRVSEMEAYADALGAFIDEKGDAKGLLEDLQTDVADVEETVADLEASLERAEADRRDLRDTLDVVEAELATLDDVEDRLDRVAGDLDALEERVSGVEDVTVEVDDLSTEVADLRDEMRELNQWRDQLSDVFGGGT